MNKSFHLDIDYMATAVRMRIRTRLYYHIKKEMGKNNVVPMKKLKYIGEKRWELVSTQDMLNLDKYFYTLERKYQSQQKVKYSLPVISDFFIRLCMDTKQINRRVYTRVGVFISQDRYIDYIMRGLWHLVPIADTIIASKYVSKCKSKRALQ